MKLNDRVISSHMLSMNEDVWNCSLAGQVVQGVAHSSTVCDRVQLQNSGPEANVVEERLDFFARRTCGFAKNHDRCRVGYDQLFHLQGTRK